MFQVLKDPSKPTKKSNFWRVKLELVTTIVHRDVAAIQELLRLKNINGNRADSSKVDGYRAEIDEKENFAVTGECNVKRKCSRKSTGFLMDSILKTPFQKQEVFCSTF